MGKCPQVRIMELEDDVKYLKLLVDTLTRQKALDGDTLPHELAHRDWWKRENNKK